MVKLKQLLDQHVSRNVRWMTFSGSELRVQRLWLNVRRKLCCEVMLRKRKLERVCLIAVNDMKMPIRDAEMLLLCCCACRWNGSGFFGEISAGKWPAMVEEMQQCVYHRTLAFFIDITCWWVATCPAVSLAHLQCSLVWNLSYSISCSFACAYRDHRKHHVRK